MGRDILSENKKKLSITILIYDGKIQSTKKIK